jgi:hypothetical protein
MTTQTRPVISPIQIAATGDLYQTPTDIVVDIKQAVALGVIKQAKVMTITGRRMAVSTTEAEAWAGTSERPARSDTAGAITAVSTSANDAAAGTRARTVVLEYLDADGYERVALASLDGISAVAAYQARSTGVGNASSLELLDGPVAATGLRINRAYVIEVGGASISTTNEGTISILIGGTEVLAIAPTACFSWSSWATVPRGMVGFVQGFGYSTDRSVAARITTYVRRVGFPYFRMTTFEAQSGALATPTTEVIRVAPRGEFGVTFTKDAGGQDVDVGYVIQVSLFPNSVDRDPAPELQPPPFG